MFQDLPFIAPRRSQKTTINFVTFVTGVDMRNLKYQMTHDMWHMTCNTQRWWTLSKNFRSLTFTVLERLYIKDTSTKDGSFNKWIISDKGVWRTGLARLCLLLDPIGSLDIGKMSGCVYVCMYVCMCPKPPSTQINTYQTMWTQVNPNEPKWTLSEPIHINSGKFR